MEKPIQITKDLRFVYSDLIKPVDFSHRFTLRDILKACINVQMPIENLMQLLRCNHIVDYWVEAESKPFEDSGEIEYLEIYWLGEILSKKSKKSKNKYDSGWCLHGVGIEVNAPKKLMTDSKEKKKKYIHYGIDFAPLYTLADYTIKIGKTMCIEESNKEKEIEFSPTITLIELLYTIFWELSFYGNVEERNKINKKLKKVCKKVVTI